MSTDIETFFVKENNTSLSLVFHLLCSFPSHRSSQDDSNQDNREVFFFITKDDCLVCDRVKEVTIIGYNNDRLAPRYCL